MSSLQPCGPWRERCCCCCIIARLQFILRPASWCSISLLARIWVTGQQMITITLITKRFNNILLWKLHNFLQVMLMSSLVLSSKKNKILCSEAAQWRELCRPWQGWRWPEPSGAPPALPWTGSPPPPTGPAGWKGQCKEVELFASNWTLHLQVPQLGPHQICAVSEISKQILQIRKQMAADMN